MSLFSLSPFSVQEGTQVLQDEDAAEEEPAAGALGDPAEDTPTMRQILGQVHDVISVLKVFGTFQSLTYEEDGIHVMHGQWTISDAK